MTNPVPFVRAMFVLLGAIALAVGVMLLRDTQRFVAQAVRTHGVVVDLATHLSQKGSTMYAPVVSYTLTDGTLRRFTSRESSNISLYAVGEQVEVLYIPGAFEEPRLGGFAALWASGLWFAVGGALFSGIGIAWFVVPWLGRRTADRLREDGRCVFAELERVAVDESFTVNGRNPFLVHARWTDPATKQVRTFQSERLWRDPSAELEGRKLSVFLDPTDPAKYVVDLSFLDERER